MTNDLRNLSRVAGYNSSSGSHVFNQLEWRVVEVLKVRIWCQSHVDGRQITPYLVVWDDAGEYNGILQARLLNFFLEFTSQRAVTDHEKTRKRFEPVKDFLLSVFEVFHKRRGGSRLRA